MRAFLIGFSAGLAMVTQIGTARPASSAWSDDRKAEIAACRERGGLPVILAGVLASDGIGCAQPLGWD